MLPLCISPDVGELIFVVHYLRLVRHQRSQYNYEPP